MFQASENDNFMLVAWGSDRTKTVRFAVTAGVS